MIGKGQLLKMCVAFDQAISFSGVDLGKQSHLCKRLCTEIFITALFVIGKKKKTSESPAKRNGSFKIWHIALAV